MKSFSIFEHGRKVQSQHGQLDSDRNLRARCHDSFTQQYGPAVK